MTRVFFTADLHFNHANLVSKGHRKFADVNEMNAVLVQRWMETVGPQDHVYILGDVSFAPAATAADQVRVLPGVKHLVAGNHDHKLRRHDAFNRAFKWVKDLTEIKVEGQRIVLCHYALLTWNQMHRGSWMLHGHSHNALRPDPNARRLDVGVDAWDYRPVSFEQIRAQMAERGFKPVDHHKEKDDT